MICMIFLILNQLAGHPAISVRVGGERSEEAQLGESTIALEIFHILIWGGGRLYSSKTLT